MLGVGQKRQRALILALLASLLLWNIPFGEWLLYPFKLMATWLHELSHGIVMMLTGAGFHHLEIFKDTSGIAQANSGVNIVGRAAIHSAGYMGTALFGAILLVIGQTRTGARSVLASLGAALGISSLLWIQNDFGQISAYIGMTILLVISLIPSERIAVLVVNFIAVEACIHSLLDIRVLYRSEMVVNGKIVESGSDAHNMALATFGTVPLWASIWLAWSCLCFFVALRIIYTRHRRHDQRSIWHAARSQAQIKAQNST